MLQPSTSVVSKKLVLKTSVFSHSTSPSNHSTNLCRHFLGDLEASASGLAGAGKALTGRAEITLLDYILVDSRVCAVERRRSCRVTAVALIDCICLLSYHKRLGTVI